MKKIFLFAIILAMLSSCSTLLSGSESDVSIISNPSGANVIINGKEYGKTPVNVVLENDGYYNIQFKLDGYEPFNTHIRKKISCCFWGNLIVGGVVGMAIDYATGSIYSLETDEVIVTLSKSNTISNQKSAEGNFYVFTTLTPDKNWKKIGTMKKIN